MSKFSMSRMRVSGVESEPAVTLAKGAILVLKIGVSSGVWVPGVLISWDVDTGGSLVNNRFLSQSGKPKFLLFRGRVGNGDASYICTRGYRT